MIDTEKEKIEESETKENSEVEEEDKLKEIKETIADSVKGAFENYSKTINTKIASLEKAFKANIASTKEEVKKSNNPFDSWELYNDYVKDELKKGYSATPINMSISQSKKIIEN